MNKKIMLAVAAMAVAAVLGLIFSQNLSVSADPSLTKEEVRDKVEAQYPGEITELELERNGKNPVYEIEIVIEGKEYDLLIDGNTGEVLKLDERLITATSELEEASKEDGQKDTSASNKEDDALNIEEKVKDDKATTEPANENNTNENSNDKKSVISTEQATDIALEQFSGRIENVELDTENGRLVYEIEIESKRGEADIEIDAYTGEVLVVDIDLDDDYRENAEATNGQSAAPKNTKENSNDKKSVISTEKATDIALEQFSGRIENVELDTEDGRTIYEIEIESKDGEADIEIDAYTGEVLVVDIDLEDDDD